MSLIATRQIADGAITNAKRADMAQNTIKARKTASTGPEEDATAAEVRSILNVANGATANSSDATLLARGNHTGTQLASTISDFAAGVRAVVLTGLSLSTNQAITATDTALQAFGYLQKQITDLSGSVPTVVKSLLTSDFATSSPHTTIQDTGISITLTAGKYYRIQAIIAPKTVGGGLEDQAHLSWGGTATFTTVVGVNLYRNDGTVGSAAFGSIASSSIFNPAYWNVTDGDYTNTILDVVVLVNSGGTLKLRAVMGFGAQSCGALKGTYLQGTQLN